MDIEELRAGLERFIADEVGSSSKLESLAESDGHAGLTFLFDIVESSGLTKGFVIKLPPKGVKRKGNTDVYRQAPLLRALHADANRSLSLQTGRRSSSLETSIPTYFRSRLRAPWRG